MNETNPWADIALKDYESHMSSDNVFQLQTLNQIMAEQSLCRKNAIAILGVAGGNGLEHFREADVIYAIDINEEYLMQCRMRFSYFGDKLKLICQDLNYANLPKCQLLICNLIIEYIGIEMFVSLLKRTDFEVVSCVIQKNKDNHFVSISQSANKLDSLSDYHKDIDEKGLVNSVGLPVVLKKIYKLPNGKEFIRLDFAKSSFEE